MNLMKWFRKNNKKIMAIVVVVIMFGFIAGPALRYFARVRTGRRDTVAYFADNRKITRNDLMSAHQELEILRFLGASDLLRSQGLRAILLGELLFSEQRVSPVLINGVRRMIVTNGYRVSDKQISDIYNRPLPAEYYWFLLEREAHLAGIRVTDENVGRLLGQVLPQLFRGAAYSQVIQSIIERQGIPEKQILETFGKLLAVLQYSHVICSGEYVTNPQIMHAVSHESETIDVELVEFESSVFADALYEPNEAALVEHFDKYRKFFAGTPSEENPYCIGYKLPDRVQLEYIACRLDDVSEIVTPPTSREKEQYYQKNMEQFKESVLSDPNDPNSLQIERTKSYAEVASLIADGLLQNKINSQAEKILQEAKALTSVDSSEGGKGDDYRATAEQLGEKYKIKIYAGQTGLLSAEDFQADRYLRTLYLESYGNNPVRLPQIVFAIDEIKAADLGLFNMPRPKMYENIGPLRDLLGKIMVLVRVIKAEPACEPQSIDQTFSIDGLVLDPNEHPESENIYSVREKVTEDLKDLAAMDTARSKAEEFVKLAEKDGWDSAINKFNDLYGEPAKQGPNEPNVFWVHTLPDLRRVSNAILQTLAVQSVGNLSAAKLAKTEVAKQFVDKLYSLVPQDSNTIGTAGLIMEFKPDMSFYVIKDISVKRLNQAEYARIKPHWLYREDSVQVQSMAAEYFNPANILKRVNFRWAEGYGETKDANAPPEESPESVRLGSPSKSEVPS
jgi:hypothetical protein